MDAFKICLRFEFMIILTDIMALNPVDALQQPTQDDQMDLSVLPQVDKVLDDLYDPTYIMTPRNYVFDFFTEFLASCSCSLPLWVCISSELAQAVHQNHPKFVSRPIADDESTDLPVLG